MERLSDKPGLHREFLDRLARALTDQGLLIEAGWVSLRAATIPADAPAEQLHDMRATFFAGAQHLFGSMMGMLDPDEEPTAADMERMNKIDAELRQFIEEFELRNLPAEGRA
jgi:hypothetical protein